MNLTEILSQWILSQWILSQWILSQWFFSMWVLSQLILANWENIVFDSLPWIIGLLVVIFSAYWGPYRLWREQQKREEYNIAQALYLDISQIEDHFNSALADFNDNAIEFIASANLNALLNDELMLWDPRPYYTDNGAYFAFQRDISKFDSDLSAKLYSYYHGVIDIEFKRQYIDNCISKVNNRQFISSNESVRGGLYTRTMTAGMKGSIGEAEDIKRELKKRYKLNLNLPIFYNRVFNTKVYSRGDEVHARDLQLWP